MAGVRDEPASHSGDLGKTPVAHLLVYAVDRKLTGELTLIETSGAETIVRFERGAPVKVRVSDGFARLGDMLIAEGAIDEKTLAGALATQGLLGDVLLLVGCVSRGVLEATCDKQLRRRVQRLFELPEATRLRYVDGGNELEHWGGDGSNVDPLELLWCGVREHGSSALGEALTSIGQSQIAISAAAPLERFGFTDDERLLLDHFAVTPSTLAEVAEFDLVPRETLDRLVYLVIIARLAEFAGGPAESTPLGAPKSSAVLRMQLRPLQQRLGAAAPDPPGAGERAPISSRSRKGGFTPPEGLSTTEKVAPPCEEAPTSAPDADARSSSPSDPSPLAKLFKG